MNVSFLKISWDTYYDLIDEGVKGKLMKIGHLLASSIKYVELNQCVESGRFARDN